MITFRQFLTESDKTQFMVISEGGLAGHLNHLYDDHELTFGEIKDIFYKATQGKLKTVEKTDGQNIYLGFDIQTQTARAVRNKGALKKGGLTPDEFAEVWKDRPVIIRQSFVAAIQAFENTVKQMSPEEQVFFFGPDNNIFYNCEIVNPLTSNVIQYNKNYILIHTSGHTLREPYRLGNNHLMTEEAINKRLDPLNKALDLTQKEFPQDYQFTIDPALQLRKVADDSIYRSYAARLEAIMNQFRLTDKNTVRDYLQRYITYGLQSGGYNLSKNTLKALTNYILRIPEANGKIKMITAIKKQAALEAGNDEIRNIIDGIVKNKKQLLKDATSNLESIIHDFAVEMLKGVQSAFVLHPDDEIKRLQGEVQNSIDAIQASDNEIAHATLEKELQKLKGADNITSSAEGVVFSYNNKIYKFSGNFAPINQLLGIFKYGRYGPIEPLEQQNIDDQPTIAIVPGSFKPPHAGHLQMVEYYSKMADKVEVIISSPVNKLRTMNGGGVITPEQSKQIFDLYIQDAGLNNVEVKISPLPSPISATYDYIEKELKNVKVILGCSQKGRDHTRWNIDRVTAYFSEKNPTVTILNPIATAAPVAGYEDKPISAGDIRKDISKLEAALPPKSRHRESEILNILGLRTAAADNENTYQGSNYAL